MKIIMVKEFFFQKYKLFKNNYNKYVFFFFFLHWFSKVYKPVLPNLVSCLKQLEVMFTIPDFWIWVTLWNTKIGFGKLSFWIVWLVNIFKRQGIVCWYQNRIWQTGFLNYVSDMLTKTGVSERVIVTP